MLPLVDALLTVLHLLIIGFNLFGWIFPATRKLHFIVIMLTAGSWFILGIWFGIGYCPITHWQWEVKEKLGEGNLPGSFITYFANKITGRQFTDDFVNKVTLVCFLAAVLLSVYVNFIKRNKGRR
ncbi:DUF2784 domain-containing protein [Niastella caeni]|uniref:DUF2784 domain-containing protein n=1 Tax=Niastella caeni TaxID=2569763 RepID=A0A4S8HDH0_9BACT|nr:DUF2784 domain-containing protein [Niastella caeni]THU32977.1 DUF2784 domain-containing protein [Niastella caeni]